MLKIRQYRNLDPGEQIVLGCDPGTGENNYSAGQFLSRTRFDIPIVYHTKEMATTMTNDLFPLLERVFDITGVEPLVAYERGNGGQFEIQRLAELNRRGKYRIYKIPGTDKLGYDTNSATRPKMLADLKEAVDKRLFTIYDELTLDEMFSFIISEKGMTVRAQHEKGAVDDLVMALAIAWQLHIETPMQAVSVAAQENRQFSRRRQ